MNPVKTLVRPGWQAKLSFGMHWQSLGPLIHMLILLSWVLEPLYSQHPTSQAARQGWSESLASTFKRAPEASVGLGGFSHTWTLVG